VPVVDHLEFKRGKILIIGIIPARGGSKGIPRKNLCEVEGKHLIVRGIELLGQTECDQLFVSTDDAEIANISRKNGADVIDRPKELAEDQSSTESVLFHAVESLGLLPDDILVLHQITSPLILGASVNSAITLLKNDANLNSVLSVREAHPFMWMENNQNSWDPSGHERNFRPRRQDLGVQGIETGGIYVMRVGALMSQQSRFPKPTSVIKVTYLESLDIDSYEDLEVARLLIKSASKGVTKNGF
jgi:CMP-N,N'-diacetyllegionaminic acid synthase